MDDDAKPDGSVLSFVDLRERKFLRDFEAGKFSEVEAGERWIRECFARMEDGGMPTLDILALALVVVVKSLFDMAPDHAKAESMVRDLLDLVIANVRQDAKTDHHG